MKRSTKVILFGSIGVLAVGGMAFAAKGYQEHREMHRMFSPQKMIERLDTDGDSAFSLAELNAAIAEQFAQADPDGDGSVYKADVVLAIEERSDMGKMKRRSGRITDRLFIASDIDSDGKITVSELENRTGKFFALVDWNDDGKVEMAEVKRMRSSLPPGWGKGHRR